MKVIELDFFCYSSANMFERLARKEELEAGQTQRRDVFQEATDEEMRKLSNSSGTNPLPAKDQEEAPSTEVNGQGNADVEMKEDDKGGVVCWHPGKNEMTNIFFSQIERLHSCPLITVQSTVSQGKPS